MKSLKKQIKTLSVVIAMAIVITIFPFTGNVQAQPVSACDPQYMDALESRAWLEAQREITQNQNLIQKPDSVLEYSCFNRFLNHVSRRFNVDGVNRPFSTTNHWNGTPIGLSINSTARTLDQTVLVAMTSYLTANFNHNFLGDRLGERYMPSGNVSRTAYNCDMMARVWEQARCLNFMQRPDEDGFFDFPWYQNNDPRDLPNIMAACTPPGGLIGSTLDSAFNERPEYFTLQDENPFASGSPYEQDPVLTHIERITPGNCSDSNHILTGIMVRRSGEPAYAEIVCTNPGCSQSGTGRTCGLNPTQ